MYCYVNVENPNARDFKRAIDEPKVLAFFVLFSLVLAIPTLILVFIIVRYRSRRRRSFMFHSRLTIAHSISRHHRVGSIQCRAICVRRARNGRGIRSIVAADRYNKWDNDITGTPRTSRGPDTRNYCVCISASRFPSFPIYDKGET